MISNKAPSAYLPALQTRGGVSSDEMDILLLSHVIEPSVMRADDFATFFETRKEALLRRIEKATGKPIAREILELEESFASEEEIEAEVE